jgi:hypothetical protein
MEDTQDMEDMGIGKEARESLKWIFPMHIIMGLS